MLLIIRKQLVLTLLFLVLQVRSTLSSCRTVYTKTYCDNYVDVQKNADGIEEWTDLLIGSGTNTTFASVNLQSLPFARMNNVRVITVIGAVGQVQRTSGSQCTYDNQIEEFNYFGNVFPELYSYTFPVLKLRRLNLIDNAIGKIGESSFFAHSIEHLDLSRNKIEIIQLGAFENIRDTKVLILSQNSIANIDPGSLPGSLQVLDLSGNKLRFLQDSLLENLPHLKDLSLKDNRFANLPNIHLIPSLIVLDVSSNAIKDIGKDALDNNTKLKLLDVSRNELRRVPFLESFFANNSEDATLNLAFNRIRELHNVTVNVRKQTIFLFGNPWDCAEWESVKAKFDKAQNSCDKMFFNSGNTPYCLAWTELFYPFQSDSERDVTRFVEEIKKNEKLVDCKLKANKAAVLKPVVFGCVAR